MPSYRPPCLVRVSICCRMALLHRPPHTVQPEVIPDTAAHALLFCNQWQKLAINLKPAIDVRSPLERHGM